MVGHGDALDRVECGSVPLPPREREGTRAPRGKGEGTAKDRSLNPRATLTRPLRGHPLPGRERGWRG
ncbi:hypothetical protein DS837_26005 [Azospirillum brasilense]|uniref:Uncharacterized protein n=1 Tax=Azospirillum brasilense TaxID=192 RepID=A0A6L3ATK9_AZOBR|nr:hypothetical protein DS837_26005 [Azospirillum brasilense]